MTKEEIIKKHLKTTESSGEFNHFFAYNQAMQEYADQQTTSLKAEVESLQSQLAVKDKEYKNDVRLLRDAMSHAASKGTELICVNGRLKEQLAKAEADKKELLDALYEVKKSTNPQDVTPYKKAHGLNLGEYYVGGCSMPSDKAIHMVINAINKHENKL